MNNILPDVYKCGMLEDSMVTDLEALHEELVDTWAKRQVFRTETEMRVSVLQDGKHPTNASKYWQAVREQAMFFENLATAGFEYRRNEVVIKRKIKAIAEATDPLDIEGLQVDLDECYFRRAAIKQVAQDRMRELKLWSQIKAELDDGTFDTKDVNTHQMESLWGTLVNRRNALSQASTQPEILNVIGPLATIERLKVEKKTREEPKKAKALSSVPFEPIKFTMKAGQRVKG